MCVYVCMCVDVLHVLHVLVLQYNDMMTDISLNSDSYLRNFYNVDINIILKNRLVIDYILE